MTPGFPVATNRIVVFSESTGRSSSMGSMSHIRSSSLPVQRFQTSNRASLQKRIPSSGVTHSISSSLAAVDERNDFADGSDIDEVSGQISSRRSSTVGTPPWDRASTSEASGENQVRDLYCSATFSTSF